MQTVVMMWTIMLLCCVAESASESDSYVEVDAGEDLSLSGHIPLIGLSLV